MDVCSSTDTDTTATISSIITNNPVSATPHCRADGKQLQFNREIELLQKQLLAAITSSQQQQQQQSDDKDGTIANNGNNNSFTDATNNTRNNNNDKQSQLTSSTITQQSLTPCTCEHCQLCPVIRKLARLTSSESGTTTDGGDNNKNIPGSLTTSDVSLTALPEEFSVQKTLETLKLITNNNQQMQQEAATAEAQEIVLAQHLQEQQQADNFLAQKQRISYNNKENSNRVIEKSDKWEWDAIEKVLDSTDNDLSYSEASSKYGPTSNKHQHHRRRSSGAPLLPNSVSASDDVRGSGCLGAGVPDSSVAGNNNSACSRRNALKGDKQHNYEQHHSFFVTQALQHSSGSVAASRRAQLVENNLSDTTEIERNNRGAGTAENNGSSRGDNLLERRIPAATNIAGYSREQHLDDDDAISYDDDLQLDDEEEEGESVDEEDSDESEEEDSDNNESEDNLLCDDDSPRALDGSMSYNTSDSNRRLISVRHEDDIVASSELDSSHDEGESGAEAGGRSLGYQGSMTRKR